MPATRPGIPSPRPLLLATPRPSDLPFMVIPSDTTHRENACGRQAARFHRPTAAANGSRADISGGSTTVSLRPPHNSNPSEDTIRTCISTSKGSRPTISRPRSNLYRSALRGAWSRAIGAELLTVKYPHTPCLRSDAPPPETVNVILPAMFAPVRWLRRAGGPDHQISLQCMLPLPGRRVATSMTNKQHVQPLLRGRRQTG